VITFTDIQHAHERIAPFLSPTPLEPVPDLGEQTYFKLENLNKTRSFKVRGALNAMLTLSPAERAHGVVAVSSGNHAQAISYAAKLTNTHALILMPMHTPQKKVKGTQSWGAEVRLFGANYDETELEGRRIEREQGMTFISPYNHRAMIEGAGTIGIEIVEQLSSVQRVIIGVGGGGLVSGVGLALKHLVPSIEVIGVNAESAPTLFNIIHGTHHPEVWDTLAEALSGDIEQDSLTRQIAPQVIDHMLKVSEEQIAHAMRYMIEQHGWLVEGGGAVSLAPVLNQQIALDNKPTVMIVCGGNLDSKTIIKVLEQG
jgi:threonine dehydratase